MSYATIDREVWPVGADWSELEYLSVELRRVTLKYMLIVEQGMLSHVEPRHRFLLIKWNRNPAERFASQKEVVCEHSDIRNMINVLTMLVSVEKELKKERDSNERRT